METKQIHCAEETTANSRRRSSTNRSFPATTLARLAASLLILLGAAFELGMLGLGPYNSSDAWLFSVIGKNTWIALTDLVVPELRETIKIWPLILVTIGAAILLIAQTRNRFHSTTPSSSGRKENHAN